MANVGYEGAKGIQPGAKGKAGSTTETAGCPPNNYGAGREPAAGTGYSRGGGSGVGPGNTGQYHRTTPAAGMGSGSKTGTSNAGRNPAENFRTGGTPFKQPTGTSPRSSGGTGGRKR